MSYPVETLDDWNKLLECCCEMPACPLPLETCESITGTADAADTTYDIALADWEAARTAWVAEDPETRVPEDYPIPAPEPPSEDLEDGVIGGAWGPFAEPVGAPDDDLPAIYRRLKTSTERYEGTWGFSELNSETFDLGGDHPELGLCVWGWVGANGFYSRETVTPVDGVVTVADFVTHTSQWHYPCAEETEGPLVFMSTISDSGTVTVGFYPTWTADTPPDAGCTATKRYIYDTYETADYGTDPGVPSLPIPGDQSYSYSEWATDASHSLGLFYDLFNPITKTELAAAAIADIPADWPEPPTAAGCQASLSALWPLIQDLYTGDPGAWPDCATGDLPIETGATASATKVKVQFKVPITHTGTYFAVLFDVIEEPEGWDDTIPDPEYVGPGPAPQIPKPGRPLRSWFEQNVARNWTGPGTGDQDNPSWNMGAPYVIEPPSVPGVRRIVNRRFWCYPSSPYGFLPQITGEGVEL